MEQNSVVNVILYNDFEQILYRSTENLTRRRPRFPFNHLAELGVGKYTHTQMRAFTLFMVLNGGWPCV